MAARNGINIFSLAQVQEHLAGIQALYGSNKTLEEIVKYYDPCLGIWKKDTISFLNEDLFILSYGEIPYRSYLEDLYYFLLDAGVRPLMEADTWTN